VVGAIPAGTGASSCWIVYITMREPGTFELSVFTVYMS